MYFFFPVIVLIFFIAAHMVLLCFGFVLKADVFITAEQSLHRVQGFSAPHPTSKEAGGEQGVGRGHRRDSWPQLTCENLKS